MKEYERNHKKGETTEDTEHALSFAKGKYYFTISNKKDNKKDKKSSILSKNIRKLYEDKNHI